MSYCRFSTDCFRCDVYAYADVAGGWTIHVAARKRDIPADWRDPLEQMMDGLDREDEKDMEARIAEYRGRYAAMEELPWFTLSAPSAGMTFHEGSLEAFRERMVLLRAEGLRFPDDVFDEIDAEIAEASVV